MASKRRGGFRPPELRGTLGTLLRTTTSVVRDALERGAREGRARLDDVRGNRRRTDALAELGELVLELIRAGEIDLAELPEARDLVRHLDELDESDAGPDSGESLRASWRRRFDDRDSPSRLGDRDGGGPRASGGARDSGSGDSGSRDSLEPRRTSDHRGGDSRGALNGGPRDAFDDPRRTSDHRGRDSRGTLDSGHRDSPDDPRRASDNRSGASRGALDSGHRDSFDDPRLVADSRRSAPAGRTALGTDGPSRDADRPKQRLGDGTVSSGARWQDSPRNAPDPRADASPRSDWRADPRLSQAAPYPDDDIPFDDELPFGPTDDIPFEPDEDPRLHRAAPPSIDEISSGATLRATRPTTPARPRQTDTESSRAPTKPMKGPWRRPDPLADTDALQGTEPPAPTPEPSRRLAPDPHRKGGISFDDDDLNEYMHPDDVPPKGPPRDPDGTPS